MSWLRKQIRSQLDQHYGPNRSRTVDRRDENLGKKQVYYLPQGALFERWPTKNVDTESGLYIRRQIGPGR